MPPPARSAAESFDTIIKTMLVVVLLFICKKKFTTKKREKNIRICSEFAPSLVPRPCFFIILRGENRTY